MTWYWATLIALMPTAWCIQLFLHEGSHLLVAKSKGWSTTGLWPWPHWVNMTNGVYVYWPFPFTRPDEHWKFYFARCGYAREGVRKVHDLVAFAPFLTGLTFFVAGLLLNWLVPITGWFFPLVICAFGEMVRFWWTYFWGSPTTDGKRWRHGEKGTL